MAAAQAAPGHKLLVVSVDGLDWRYIRDRDALGLRIPNIRKLIARSQVADGVVGVWPTITWPSHTAIISGARPDQSG
ncbi:MAG TPA: alkaline phosphatase family protein, partial [Aggregatilineales bacterium]|nr:alkaline phosphatase family protein [Aggregatilineales bacterium]